MLESCSRIRLVESLFPFWGAAAAGMSDDLSAINSVRR